MKTVLDDLSKSHRLTVPKAVNVAKNWPLWTLPAMSGTMHS